MAKKKNTKKPLLWNVINILILFAISVFILNGAEGSALYAAVAALFFFSGIFLKRAYIFAGILILVAVTAFVVQGDIFESINFFINSKG